MWENIKEYFKEHSKTEKKKLSEMTLKEKAEYIWEYYKLHIIGALVVVLIAGSLIHNALNPPLPPFAGIGFYEVYLSDEVYAELNKTITDTLIANPDELELYFHPFIFGDDPSVEMAIAQKLMAMVMINELDLLVASGEYFDSFMYQDFFLDLNELDMRIPEELLLYSESIDNPEVLPYGVSLNNSRLLRELGLRESHGLNVGVMGNSLRMEATESILNMLLAQ